MLIRQISIKYFYFTYTFILLHSEVNVEMSNVEFAVLDIVLAVSHPINSHRLFLNFFYELADYCLPSKHFMVLREFFPFL